METLTIDTDVPIPNIENRGRGARIKNDYIRETILNMYVGDSVGFSDYKLAMRFRARAWNMFKRDEITGKFIIRAMYTDKTEPVYWRVWRVS